jgi:WD40 repeat protein
VAGESALLYDFGKEALSASAGQQAESAEAAAADSIFRLHTVAVSSRPGLRFAKGVLVVRLRDGLRSRVEPGAAFTTGDAGLDALLASHGLLLAERLFPWDCADRTGGECAFLRLTFPEDTRLEELMVLVAGAAGVAAVEPVGVHRVNFFPNDPLFGNQWALNQNLDHDVNAPEAWDLERGDSSVIVAIVDTGVDWMHPDLGGPAPYTGGNIWTNWTEFNGTPGVDDDGNGFIDDVRGWDFVAGGSDLGPCPAEETGTADNNPADFFGHGTHVAGIAAAVGNNGAGVSGLAPQCKIMPVRAGWCAAGYGGVVRMDFCAQGIMYAARNGARIINCSWNSDSSGGMDVAADTAIARGVILSVSAGNQGNSSQVFNYLSTRGDCFDVAATDTNDIKAMGSSYGAWIDFCAPGTNILSTFYNAARTDTFRHWYAFMSGTSMAAPFVSGLSALVLSKDPSLTTAEVRSVIASTCRPIDELNRLACPLEPLQSCAGLLGEGRIDAYAALSLGSGDWAKLTGGAVSGSPLPVRIGSQTYAVVTSADGCVYVLNSDGNLAAGWPKCLPGRLTSPAAGHLDSDGVVEIVAASDSGYVCVWKAGGSPAPGWPVRLPSAVVSGPMLCDFDEDGALEIVCGTADAPLQATLHVLEANLTETMPPVDLTGSITSEPGFANIGTDSSSVILVGTSDSKLRAYRHDGTLPSGWPVTLGTALVRSPVAADVDGDGRSEIFAGDSDGYVYGLDDLGSSLSGWPRTGSAGFSRSLALGDVDGDSIPEVVGACSDGAVFAWTLEGQVLPGWPVHAPAAVSSSPSVADLDADGKCEVAVGCDDNNVYVWSSNGSALPGWPRSTSGDVKSSPCIDDFDGDGQFELVVGSDDRKVRFWNIGDSNALDSIPSWPMFRHDAYRTGNSGLKFVIPSAPASPHLSVVASPNPFGGGMAGVAFKLSVVGGQQRPADRRGTLLILDVAGRVVARIPVTGEGRELSVSWDGGNDSSRKLGSGVYVYRAEVDGMKTQGKLVFLKR